MGKWYLFKCDNCEYAARVSGGKDRGFHAFVETKVCGDCRKLVDVVVGLANKMSGPLAQTEDGNTGRCSFCKGCNIRKWDPAESACPRCEGKMVRSEEDVWFWD